jgi:hypothetical protein
VLSEVLAERAGRKAALLWAMPELTRRRSPERTDCWQVCYGDVRVVTIAARAGVPIDVDQWGSQCGFYPASHNGWHCDGAAAKISGQNSPQLPLAPPSCGILRPNIMPARSQPMDTDNKIIAAHRAAALIAKSEMPHTPKTAVQRFNQVYEILEEEKAERAAKRR